LLGLEWRQILSNGEIARFDLAPFASRRPDRVRT
jgi:hypothetical protein